VKRLAFALAALAPALASAQPVPTNPVPDAPVTLSPGASGNQTPAPRPSGNSGPGVVIVGPDGRVMSGDSAPAGPQGYYVPSDGGTTNQGPGINMGPVPELHVVRSGDTLWDICFFYFNDPFQWPKIWSYNPQITNPHWIYPGDLVRLLPRGVFSSTTQQPDNPSKPPDQAPTPTRKTDVGIRNVAFVEKSDLDQAIVIDGAVDEKLLLGNNDQVYLSYPKNKTPVVGKRYSIYQPGQPVAGYGSYVRVLGTLEVLSVKDEKRARAVIVEANQEIERGSKVGPLVTKFRNAPPVPPKVDAQGPIVAMLKQDQLIGQGEVVFIALGKGSGVEVGNRMFVVRRGDAYPATMSEQVGQDDRRFPARALGEVVVVDVGENVSVALVTLSVQEMTIGDKVMMQKAP
jgi:LysM domain-containing protein